MNFQEMAMMMFPYWIFGLMLIGCTIQAGFKDVLRVDFKAILLFLQAMIYVTIMRVVIFKLFPSLQNLLPGDPKTLVNAIPLGGTLFVFWEDMAHTLPLIILFRYLNDSKAANYVRLFLTAIVMFAFGMGHTYQGYLAAFAISFYIPYSIKLGEKFGVGTVMICHTLFDFTTLLTLRALLG